MIDKVLLFPNERADPNPFSKKEDSYFWQILKQIKQSRPHKQEQVISNDSSKKCVTLKKRTLN